MSRRLITLLVALLVVGLLLPMALGGKKPSATEKEAIAAAHTWLAHVDKKNYDKSWDESATLFKEAVPRGAWVEQIDGVRTPLGAVKTRVLLGSRQMKELPGAPSGDYVVIQFQTTFEHKKDAVETITPMMDGKRGWRVSGYYIK